MKERNNYEESIRTSIIARRIEIFIDGDITDPEDFRNEVHALRSAGPNDEVLIYLNTHGGRLDTAKSIINAILLCEGSVTAILEGTIASAGTMIACACPNVQVMPHTEFMIHSAIGGTYGTVRNAADSMAFQHKMVEDFFRDVYAHFLTDDEIEYVLHGRELWMDSDEIVRRFKARQEHILQAQGEEEDGDALPAAEEEMELVEA